jgi:hypothetical protein
LGKIYTVVYFSSLLAIVALLTPHPPGPVKSI